VLPTKRPAVGEYAVLGRRIVIYGATGSGKTTLARRLGEILGLGVIQLDAIRHDGAFDATPWDLMRQRVEELIASYPDGWVCEGNYSRLRDASLSRADTLISLDLPWRTSFSWLFKRTVCRALDRRTALRTTWTAGKLARQLSEPAVDSALVDHQSSVPQALHGKSHHRGTRRHPRASFAHRKRR